MTKTQKEKIFPLMPKAVAVWLIDNTTLTFSQIASFCGLHALEVQAIADGEVAIGMQGTDPTHTGELDQEELDKAIADESYDMQISHEEYVKRKKTGSKYTPVTKRGDKPNAIAWMVKHMPNVPDSVVCKLLGTTKNTISAIRDRTHWNIKDITAKNPVQLELCKQHELDRLAENYKTDE